MIEKEIRMAGEALERGGMHFDDLNRIRVLDEDTASQVDNITDLDSFWSATFLNKKRQPFLSERSLR